MTNITSAFSVYSPFQGSIPDLSGSGSAYIDQLEKDIQALSDLTNPNGGPMATDYAKDPAAFIANFNNKGGYADQIAAIKAAVLNDINNAFIAGNLTQSQVNTVWSGLAVGFSDAEALGGVTSQDQFTQLETDGQTACGMTIAYLQNMFPPF